MLIRVFLKKIETLNYIIVYLSQSNATKLYSIYLR